MIKKENNFAYIDGANLYEGNKSLGNVPIVYLNGIKEKIEKRPKKLP